MSGSDESARLERVYDLSATAAWIRAGGFRRVALQIPDDLLHDAVNLAAALERRCVASGDAATASGGDAVPPTRVFVLADTTFGSCCVDEVAAAHHAADAIVHFGRACMSPVARLPARFVFNKEDLDADACAKAIAAHASALGARNAKCVEDNDDAGRVDAVVVLVDQEHAHATDELRRRVETAMASSPASSAAADAPPVTVAKTLPVEALPRERAARASGVRGGGGCCGGGGCGGAGSTDGPIPNDDDDNDDGGGHAEEELTDATSALALAANDEADAPHHGVHRVAGQEFVLPLHCAGDRSRCAFVWVGGGESPALAQALAVLHGRCAGVAQVHPTTSRLVPEATGSTDVARVVKRRRYLIERAREAKVVGIVAGTLGVAGYLTAIERLRRVIAASGRKSYTVVAGKPNPQKLANFPEIEAFVLVACEQAALIDGRDYLQPVITPWEAEVAFTHGKVWDGEVRLDFEHLLGDDPEVHKRGHDGSGAGDDAGPEFSFLGGGVRARAADAGDGSDLRAGGAGGAEGAEGADSDSDDEVLGDGGKALALRAERAVTARVQGGGLSDVRSGAEYLLSRRTYVGLEPGPKRGEDGAVADAPLEAAQGLKGRAHGYAQER